MPAILCEGVSFVQWENCRRNGELTTRQASGTAPSETMECPSTGSVSMPQYLYSKAKLPHRGRWLWAENPPPREVKSVAPVEASEVGEELLEAEKQRQRMSRQ